MKQSANPAQKQIVLILDDDLVITEALALGLEREGRTVITCNDLGSAEVMVKRITPTHVVTDLQLSTPVKFEGLEFIRFARRHSPASRIILMTGDSLDAPELESSELGPVAFLQKPFELAELDSLLDLLSHKAEPAAMKVSFRA
jgi:DNA-binding response OmpR family regulator